MLADLKADVDVFVVYRVTPEQQAEQQATLRDVLLLLEEYADRAREGAHRVSVEYVDPVLGSGRAEALQRKYNLHTADVVVFESGGRSKSVPERDIVDYSLADYDYRTMASGVPPRRERVAFRGEEAFSSAILAVTEGKRPSVLFVTGHGEHHIEDYEPHSGYSALARTMRLDNIDVGSLSLTEAGGVPKDCDLLVIAGPRKPFHKAEVALLDRYLSTGNNMMILLDAGYTVGLDPLMEKWGLRIPGNRVVERTLVLRLGENGVSPLPGTGEELYIRRYGAHPLTKRLKDITTVLYVPTAVLPLEGAEPQGGAPEDRPLVTVLAASSENGWMEASSEEEPPKYDADRDVRGPIPVAAAVEKGSIKDVKVELKATRLVVIGDSDFIVNERASGGNEDFFMSALNWLLEREALMAVGPKLYDKARLEMDDRQATWAFVILVGILPASVAILGLGVWFMRVR